jgi:glucan phosphoethanolaminetransferase (alkaline phosphatase superfamily)
MNNPFIAILLKILIDDYPKPTDLFVYAIVILFFTFLIIFYVNKRNKRNFDYRPILIAIPVFSFILSYIGMAWGGIFVLDAIANVPEKQRFQAISTGISISVMSMFIPGILILIEAIMCTIMITIDKNRSK